MSNDTELPYSSLQTIMCRSDQTQNSRLSSPILRTTVSKRISKKQVSFCESLQIIQVENWKEYNVDVSEEAKCTCNIF